MIVGPPGHTSYGPYAGPLEVAAVKIEAAELGRIQEVAVRDFGVDADGRDRQGVLKAKPAAGGDLRGNGSRLALQPQLAR